MALVRFRPASNPSSARSGGLDHSPVWVRPADATDAAALVPLCTQLGHSCEPRDLESRLVKHASSPDYATWVAVDGDGDVFGYACGHLVRTISLGAPMAHLTAIVTDSRARGRGVGRSLIGAFDDWAEAHGAREAVYISDGRSHGAHRSLDAYGFARDGQRFAKAY